MTSVLKVDNIQNSSGTSALTIDSNGNVGINSLEYFAVELTTSMTSLADNSINIIDFGGKGTGHESQRPPSAPPQDAAQGEDQDHVHLQPIAQNAHGGGRACRG